MLLNRCMDMPKADDKMMNMNVGAEALPGAVCAPVYECPVERCCHREIVHEVPQD